MPETLHPEETVTSIIFVRHGHTKQTEQGKLYNDHAALLTEKGLSQAHAVAEWLKNESTDVLLSSTAQRVVASSDIVSLALAKSFELIEKLDEQSVGEWEGRSYLEIKKQNPEEYKAWCADPIRNRAPGGESIEDVYNRVCRDIAGLVEKHKGKRIVLVTHAGVIRSAIVEALGMPLDNFWRVSIPTGSASRIDYSPNFAMLQYMAKTF